MRFTKITRVYLWVIIVELQNRVARVVTSQTETQTWIFFIPVLTTSSVTQKNKLKCIMFIFLFTFNQMRGFVFSNYRSLNN